VRWLLNLAYRTRGGYPDRVPSSHLIPPAAFESAEDVGRFRDVAREAGLTIFASAGGTAVEDFRNTGRFDVITSMAESCGSMSFFINNGDGTFSDRTTESGLDNQLGGLNIVPGDFDNDGCLDVLVLRGGWEPAQRNSLLRNTCKGTFTDVTVESGLAERHRHTGGRVGRLRQRRLARPLRGQRDGPAQLFSNKGDGTFEDIATQAGVASGVHQGRDRRRLRQRRWIDFYVSNRGSVPNFLYRNNGDGTFTEMAGRARTGARPPGSSRGSSTTTTTDISTSSSRATCASIDEMAADYLGMPHNATTIEAVSQSRRRHVCRRDARGGLRQGADADGVELRRRRQRRLPRHLSRDGAPRRTPPSRRSVLLRNRRGPAVRERHRVVGHGRAPPRPWRGLRRSRQRRRPGHRLRGRRRDAGRPARAAPVRESWPWQ
jgi:hypothetical protein